MKYQLRFDGLFKNRWNWIVNKLNKGDFKSKFPLKLLLQFFEIGVKMVLIENKLFIIRLNWNKNLYDSKIPLI